MSADVLAIAMESDCRVLRPAVPKKPWAQQLQRARASSRNQRIRGTEDTGGNGRAGCAGSNIGELHELLGRPHVVWELGEARKQSQCSTVLNPHVPWAPLQLFRELRGWALQIIKAVAVRQGSTESDVLGIATDFA